MSRATPCSGAGENSERSDGDGRGQYAQQRGFAAHPRVRASPLLLRYAIQRSDEDLRAGALQAALGDAWYFVTTRWRMRHALAAVGGPVLVEGGTPNLVAQV
jgi:hypothetical protein